MNTFSSVGNRNPDYDRYYPLWQQNADATTGQEAIKHSPQAMAYLPMLKSQELDAQYGTEAYQQYAKYANYSDFPSITLNSFLGLINRKPTQITIPDEISYLIDDADLNGSSLKTLLRQVEREALINNRVCVLIDAPESDGEQRTIAEAERDNVRPYLSVYTALSAIDWDEARIRNKKTTTMVKLYEEEYRRSPDDEFQIDLVKKIRVLDIFDGEYRQRVYEYVQNTSTSGTAYGSYSTKDSRPDETSYELVSEVWPEFNGKRIGYIPLFPITGDGTTWEIRESVMAPMCRTAISEYRTDASYENALLITGNPVACFKDLLADQSEDGQGNLVVGSSTALNFGPDGEWGFLKLDSGLEPLENAKKAKRDQMAVQGARVLESGPNGVETEGTAEIRRMGTLSILASFTNAISESMTIVLKHFYELAGYDLDSIENDEISVSINNDFTPRDIDPQKLTAMFSMLQSNVISYETFYRYLEKNEVFKPGRTMEEELEAIQEDAQKKVDEAEVDIDEALDTEEPEDSM